MDKVKVYAVCLKMEFTLAPCGGVDAGVIL